MKSFILSVLLLTALSACSQAPDTSSQKTAETQVVDENHNANPTQASTAGSDAQHHTQKSDELKKAELADAKKITQAISLISPKEFDKKDAQWQAQVNTATTNAQVQAVLFEQRQLYEQIKQRLEQVQPQTMRGRQIHQQALNGINGMISSYHKLASYDLIDPNQQKQTADIMKQSVDSATIYTAAAKELERLGQEHNQYNQKQQQKIDERFAEFERRKQNFETSIKAVD